MSRIYYSGQKNNSRVNKLNLIRNSGQKVSIDYLSFGKDYYDNKEVLQGFGGYSYDGRYEACVDAFINDISFRKILDFGCAKGFLLYEFQKKGKLVLGVEKSNYARENSKQEVSKFIFEDIKMIEDDLLVDVDIIISRDVFPHLEPNAIRELLSIISEKCPNLKLLYLEFPVISAECSKKDLMDWDPTHKTLGNKEYWDKLVGDFGLPIETFYKNIFL